MAYTYADTLSIATRGFWNQRRVQIQGDLAVTAVDSTALSATVVDKTAITAVVVVTD